MKKDVLYKIIEKYGVVVYGAGRIGQNVYSMLKDWGCSPLMAWDKNAQNIRDSIEIEEISEPIVDYKNKQIPIIVCINAKVVYDSVLKELTDQGFVNVYWIREIEQNQLCGHSKTFFLQKCNKCVVNRGGAEHILTIL